MSVGVFKEWDISRGASQPRWSPKWHWTETLMKIIVKSLKSFFSLFIQQARVNKHLCQIDTILDHGDTGIRHGSCLVSLDEGGRWFNKGTRWRSQVLSQKSDLGVGQGKVRRWLGQLSGAYSSDSQIWAGIRITWKACSDTNCWVPPPENQTQVSLP